MRFPQILIVILLLCCGGLLTAQELGTYVDEEGRLHLTDNPRQGWRKLHADGTTSGSSGAGVYTVRSVPASTPFAETINHASKTYGLDAYLIKAVIEVESNYDSNAVSSADAKGLMQLMDSTAAMLGVTDSFDPRQNILAGSRHLRNLLRVYDGNLRMALAAYNAGQGAVARYGGVPPYKETIRYLKKISDRYQVLDYRISKAELETSLVVARALSHGRTTIYRYETANGYALSEIPPAGRAYMAIPLNK